MRGKFPNGNAPAEAIAEFYQTELKAIPSVADWGYRAAAKDPTPILPCPILVASDAHAPSHDVQMFKRLRAVGALRGIKRLVLVGDTHDFAGLSRHRKASMKVSGALENMLSVLMLLDQLSRQFERIDITLGNHETNRVQVAVERMIATGAEGLGDVVNYLVVHHLINRTYRQHTADLLKRFMEDKSPDLKNVVRWHSSSRVEIRTPEHLDNYMLCHPRIYSRHAPQAEKRLWPKYLRPVGGAHGHLFGVGLSPDGRHPVFQWGCMTQPDEHSYITDEDTDHPRWAQGFCLINEKGLIEFYVNNPYLTDWTDIDAKVEELDHAATD